MADLIRLGNVRRMFCDLLEDLSATWPSDQVAYVRDEVDHGEFGDALENAIALAGKHDLHFDDRQLATVFALAKAMDMLDSPWVAKLPQHT